MNHDFFDESLHAHWLAGLIAADGCIVGDSWRFSQSGDEGLDLVRTVQEMIGHKLKVNVWQPPAGQTAYANLDLPLTRKARIFLETPC